MEYKQETKIIYKVSRPSTDSRLAYLYTILREFKLNPTKVLTPRYLVRKLDLPLSKVNRVLNHLEHEGRLNIGNDINNEPSYTLNTTTVV